MPVNGQPPAVLQVMTRLNVGGPARAVISLQRALSERGFEPTLVHGSVGPAEGEIPPAGTAIRVPSMTRSLDPARDLAAYRRVRALIHELRPAVVHTHMAKAGALGRIAASRGGVPAIVHTFHGHVLQEYFGRLTNAAFAEAERRLARRTHALIAVAPRVRDELLALGIGTPDQWHVVPVGIDPESVRPLDRSVARSRLGLPREGPVIGSVGRLVPVKDHDTFLRAAARVLERYPNATFVIAGDGPLREQLRRRAAELVGPRVRFLGWVDDLPTLYGAMDVAVLTSRLEGTPLVLMEAGAARIPAVASRVGGVPDVIADGETGTLVPVGDDASVAQAIDRLLQDLGEARRVGDRAADRIRSRYSIDAMAEGLVRIYRGLLERAPRTAGAPIRS